MLTFAFAYDRASGYLLAARAARVGRAGSKQLVSRLDALHRAMQDGSR